MLSVSFRKFNSSGIINALKFNIDDIKSISFSGCSKALSFFDKMVLVSEESAYKYSAAKTNKNDNIMNTAKFF